VPPYIGDETSHANKAGRLKRPITVPRAIFLTTEKPHNPYAEKRNHQGARLDENEGKSSSTQAGEFVREEIEEIREGKHGARSAKQAIAIGLSKARRAGVKLPPPEKGKTSEATRRKAKRDLEKAESGEKPSRKRSQATLKALKRESGDAASSEALSRQTRGATRQRSSTERSAAAKKAARTRKRSK
jgi:hypothetical protein